MAYYDVSGLDFLNNDPGSSSGGSPHGSSSGSSNDSPGSSSGSSGGQPDPRFGGNLEIANTRRSDPPSVRRFPRDENRGGQNAPGSAGLGVIENLGSSNLEKLMSMYDPEGLAYNFTNMLSNAYPGTRNEYGEYEPHKYDPYIYTTSGDFVYQDAEMGEPGAVLVNGQWKKPTLNRLGSALIESGTTGTYDDRGRFTMTDPFATSTSDMFTGIPTTLTPQNKLAIESSLDKFRADIYGGGGGGGGGWGSYGYGGGYGGGGGGGGGGYYDSPAGMPRGNPNELWGAQNPLQQMMISLHGGQGFQQGFARGGIVSLVT